MKLINPGSCFSLSWAEYNWRQLKGGMHANIFDGGLAV